MIGLASGRRIDSSAPATAPSGFESAVGRAAPQPGAVELAVLILNFNGYRDTRRALQSLRLVTQLSVRAIVIDNGSERDEGTPLRTEFPEAIVERVEGNLGFSRGVNYAARIALELRASYILLLNNDAWLENPDTVLLRLIDTLSTNPKLAAVGPLIVEDDETGRVQSAGYRFSLWWPLPRANRRIGSDPRAFTYLSGCCLLMCSATFVEFNGFDPDFFLYGEDVDFGLRLRRAGRTMAIVPDVRVRHRRGASSHLLSKRYVYNALRGNLIVTIKHASWYQLPVAALGSIVITFGLTAIAYRSGTKDAHVAAAKAWLDFALRRWGGLEGRRLTPSDPPADPAHYQPAERLSVSKETKLDRRAYGD